MDAGDANVTSINVKSTVEEEKRGTEAEEFELKKSAQDDEDNCELTESELVVSSYSSLNDGDAAQ